MTVRLGLAALAGLALGLAACTPPKPSEAVPDRLVLTPADYRDLAGWGDDDQAAALPALRRSCNRIGNLAPDRQFGPDPRFGTAAAWKAPCAAVMAVPPGDATAVRNTLVQWFRPVAATNNAKAEGLFTGYYEPSLKAARQRDATYTVPIMKRPPDLVMVELGDFRDALKGQRLAGRVENGRLRPYEDRARIEAGALAGRNLELYWAADPVDVFFLQIQGSGRLELPDGQIARVGYDAQNGHPYVAIGKVLVDEGKMDRADVTMQSLRAWMQAHPAEAPGLMRQNPSYVFFRELKGDGPLGGEGLALTPGRSLAIDRSLVAYGLPVWLDTTRPDTDPAKPAVPLRRLMVAQDTGGAIKGPVRGDVFWGPGPEAAEIAGRMKQSGRWWFLLPAEVAGALKP